MKKVLLFGTALFLAVILTGCRLVAVDPPGEEVTMDLGDSVEFTAETQPYAFSFMGDGNPAFPVPIPREITPTTCRWLLARLPDQGNDQPEEEILVQDEKACTFTPEETGLYTLTVESGTYDFVMDDQHFGPHYKWHPYDAHTWHITVLEPDAL